MKNVVFPLLIILASGIACSKKEVAPAETEMPVPHYDTTAVDSFSPGATSVDIANEIRISSQKYQDSLKEVLKLQQEETRIKEELEKENKKKAEAEKKIQASQSEQTDTNQE